MNPKNLVAASLVLAALLLGGGPAGATTVVRMDLKTLVNKADRIVEGEVESSYSKWDAQRRTIFTYTAIRVEDPLKGGRTRTVTIRQLGGKVGKLNVQVAGMPVFHPGDRTLVFLTGSVDGAYSVLGLNQGKFDITDETAVSNLLGIDLFDSKEGKLSHPASSVRMPVDSLKSRIRELLR